VNEYFFLKSIEKIASKTTILCFQPVCQQFHAFPSLGHGLKEAVVSHDYFGSSDKIVADLKKVDAEGFERGFVQVTENMQYLRNEHTLLIEGLKTMTTV